MRRCGLGGGPGDGIVGGGSSRRAPAAARTRAHHGETVIRSSGLRVVLPLSTPPFLGLSGVMSGVIDLGPSGRTGPDQAVLSANDPNTENIFISVT